jgi:hypothetical protein
VDGIKKAAAAVQAGAMAVLLEVPSGLCFLSVMCLFVLCVETMWVAVRFPYGGGVARAPLRSASRALARVPLASLALATLTMCA